MLTVSGLSKAHGDRLLFRDVTFQLSPGRRVALIGGNGTGKTTILEIIMGLQEADSGAVSRPNDYRVGFLPQELLESWSGSVVDEVMGGTGPVVELEAELRSLEAALSSSETIDDDLLERYGDVQSRYETLGGYHLEAEARRILGGLGFSTDDMAKPLGEMSGGWQMRAALARLLLQKPDVLLLDEPTNHLDVDSVAWLEQQLTAWSGALLFVSHDRDFIDTVAERVIEVAWNQALEYVGGFAEFVVAREERLESLRATAARQAKEIERVERFIERFRYKATKARQVQSRIKTLEKLERIEVPAEDELKLKFAFPEPRRSSRVVVEIANASIGYTPGAPVVSDVDLIVERGAKVALVGPNGAGKSTLLKVIMGHLEPLSGQSRLGSNVDVAYFAQHQVDALDLDLTVDQEFRKAVGEQPKNRNYRTVLGSFGFSGDAVDRLVGDLSGGERTRLALAEIMCNPVNLLILDEPTNHLDLPSCDLLEDALSVYPGTVLLVSHDRYLIRNTTDQLVEVRNGRAVHHLSVDEAILSPREAAPASSNGRSPKTAASSQRGGRGGGKVGGGASATVGGSAPSTKRLRELRKKVNALERKAGDADAVAVELETRLADPEVYSDRDLMNELINEHQTARSRADRYLTEWEEASVRLEEAERG